MKDKTPEFERKEPEIVYSRSVKAGKRIYYLDVKKARNEDLYLCITESKRTQAGNEEIPPTFEKHKVFLYKEDFSHFSESLQDVMDYVRAHFGAIEDRQEYVPMGSTEGVSTEESANSETESVVEDNKDTEEKATEEPVRERLSFFRRLGKKD